MNLVDLPKFLVGNREAILRLASSRIPLIVGPMLVLSGSLARNYDGAYLPGEPTVLLHGLGVSITNSFAILTLVYFIARIRRGVIPPFFGGFLAFLGLFWLTSPMAWLYAIPYERMWPGVEAIKANLNTLAFVSAWRVLLISRVLAVLFSTRFLPVLFWVLLFCDIEFFAAARLVSEPVIDIMGGLRQSEEDRLLGSVRLQTVLVSAMAFLPIFFAAVLSLKWCVPKWSVPESPSKTPLIRTLPTLAFGALAILAWAPALIWVQPEQKRRYEAEMLLKAGRVAEAFTEMSRHARADYPPMWSPPPRVSWHEHNPLMQNVRDALATQPAAPWVKHLFLDKSWQELLRDFHHYGNGLLADIVAELEDGYWRPRPEEIAVLLMHARFDDRLSDEDRESLKKLAEKLVAQPDQMPPHP